MSDPYVAEIRMVTFNFAPKGWAFCNGQILPISQNTALFSLLGTMYGGDGKSTFALPNLMGASPLHQGQNSGLSDRYVGESGGAVAVSLVAAELPAHTHTVSVSATSGTSDDPTGMALAESRQGRVGDRLYGDPTNANVTMDASAYAVAGSSAPHNNMPPYLTLNFIIALQGVYPPRT